MSPSDCFSGQWADGISSRSFDHKGIIKMTHSENKLEEALNDAIEVGAEDVTGISRFVSLYLARSLALCSHQLMKGGILYSYLLPTTSTLS